MFYIVPWQMNCHIEKKEKEEKAPSSQKKENKKDEVPIFPEPFYG